MSLPDVPVTPATTTNLPTDLQPDLKPPAKPPRVWKFWGTMLWGVLAFAAMSLGQLMVVAFEVLRSGEAFDLGLIARAIGSGTTVALSVIMGLPAVCLVLWLAIRIARQSFTDYLGLRGTSWQNVLLGTVALIVLVGAWEVLAQVTGRKSAPGFMLDVVKTSRADGTLWLLVIALTAGAAITEEILTRGFLYRGWSESFLRPVGAIVLSSLVWTAMHAQYYDPFLFSQVFSMGLLFGYLRYRTGSTWLTIYLHALNNLAATVQTLLIANGVMSP
ncbi:MAG: type II CAAX endopeptidase family protein [Tardiphaga sp.]